LPPFVPDSATLLVKVHATGLNRADILQRKGQYPPPAGESPILGLEVAGEVVSVGSAVDKSLWKTGDRCMALVGGGGYAQYIVVPAGLAMKIPANISFEEAASIPEAFLTAYQSLFLVGKVKENQKVLLHAGASGVGLSAIQLLGQVKGVQVYVTAGSQEKVNYCKKLGAVEGFNYKETKWADEILKIVPTGVDLILDPVGANYFRDDLSVLGVDGTLVMIGFLSGSVVSGDLDISVILRKRLTITGTTLRSRELKYKEELTKAFSGFGLEKLCTGAVKPVVAKVFPWQNVQEAHIFMQDDKNTGKIVLNKIIA